VRPDHGIGVIKTFTCTESRLVPLVGMPPTPPGGRSKVVDCGPFDLYWVKEGGAPPELGRPPWPVTMQVLYTWGP